MQRSQPGSTQGPTSITKATIEDRVQSLHSYETIYLTSFTTEMFSYFGSSCRYLAALRGVFSETKYTYEK